MEEKKVMSNAQKIKFQADIYYMSANLLMNEHDEIVTKQTESKFRYKLTDEEREKIFLGLPAQCLYAFCAELYLKSLILVSGNDYDKIHRFDQLFVKLDSDLKDQVEREYNSKNYYGTGFVDMLKEHSDDFQKIRYAYEPQDKPYLMSFAKWFADILKPITDSKIEKFERK